MKKKPLWYLHQNWETIPCYAETLPCESETLSDQPNLLFLSLFGRHEQTSPFNVVVVVVVVVVPWNLLH
jgi:hypothetical protein